MTTAFLGLGALGTPIAENLLASNIPLTVWNRTPGKAGALVEKGAREAKTPSDAVTTGGVVFTILWDDASLLEVVRSNGFLEKLGPNGLHISMTTVTPETSREVAALHARTGSSFVEAPIFGVPPQAVARQLIVCVAGPAAAKERAKPLLEAMGAQRIFDFGEAIGAGTATKLTGNFMIVSNLVVMREAFAVLEAAGIDPKPTFEMLTTTLFATVHQQRFAQRLIAGESAITSGIPEKDVGLFQRFGHAAGAQTPLAAQTHAILAK